MSGPLLLAYDGSDDAARAIAYAGRLLAQQRALVVHSFFGPVSYTHLTLPTTPYV